MLCSPRSAVDVRQKAFRHVSESTECSRKIPCKNLQALDAVYEKYLHTVVLLDTNSMKKNVKIHNIIY